MKANYTREILRGQSRKLGADLLDSIAWAWNLPKIDEISVIRKRRWSYLAASSGDMRIYVAVNNASDCCCDSKESSLANSSARSAEIRSMVLRAV